MKRDDRDAADKLLEAGLFEEGMPRTAFLKRGAALAATAAGLSTLGVGSARAARIIGRPRNLLTLVGADHVGLTVPDIGEAVDWFREIMGAEAPLSFGPISDPTGTLMHDLLDVDPRAVIDQITVLRIGHSANIELFQYEAPDQRRTHPRNSDWSGHHVAFYVKDIDAAVAYMEAKGVEKFLGPFSITDGPAAGQSINYFKTPFGTYIELISYPNGMAYEQPGVKPLWSPKENGTGRSSRPCPACSASTTSGSPSRTSSGAPLVRAASRLRQPAHVRADQRSERDVDARPRRRRPALGHRPDQPGPRRERREHRAVPVPGARPGPHVPPELGLRRAPHRLLRAQHRVRGADHADSSAQRSSSGRSR